MSEDIPINEESNIKTGFKVLYEKKKKYYSIFMHQFTGGIRYIPNEWIYPRAECGPLAVFDTYAHARDFLIKYGRFHEKYALFSCEYEPSAEKELYFISDMNPFMRRITNIGTYGTLYPEGTCLAKRVKLLTLVDQHGLSENG